MVNDWRPTLGGQEIYYPRTSLAWVVVLLIVGFVGAFLEIGEVAIIGFIGVLSIVPLQICAESHANKLARKQGTDGRVLLAETTVTVRQENGSGLRN